LGAGSVGSTTVENSVALNQTVELSEAPPAEVAHTAIEVGGTICFEFESELGTNYVLQCSTDLAGWTNQTFTIHGLGQAERTCDPSGFDSSKFYRIIVTD
jgi:hypothetical protein